MLQILMTVLPRKSLANTDIERADGTTVITLM